MTDEEQMYEQLAKMDFELDHQLSGLNKDIEQEMEHLNETLERDLKMDLDRMNEELDILKDSWTAGVKEFEKEAKEELVKDGYLNSSEKIESMSWSDDKIRFNNKIIKPEHVTKYREMHKKHLNRNRYRGRPE